MRPNLLGPSHRWTFAREIVKNIFKKRRQLQVASEGRNQGHLWLPLLSGGEKISQEATLPAPLRKTLEVP
ncbi:hypothetical protein J2X11_000117 [Aeromicrobium panaciterrae]|uniref:Uncharacterized protein n=1 Tax=Aeromicrobium panaciterrae TaxID=363861 RepID=A0ABU1UJB5_9ACTN|nr:hypothetical protein [Aeromicrobium panaciterrae]